MHSTENRNYGILMPVSALPSDEGIGTLGESAYAFIEYLKSAKAGVWQVLPLNPTNYGDSPYQSCSSNALNYYFIDLKTLVEEGLLTGSEFENADLRTVDRRVDYGKQFTQKVELLKKAYARFDGGEEFEKFINEGEFSDFAVFMALKCKFNHRAWTEWGEEYRVYDEKKIDAFIRNSADEVRFWHFTQYKFLQQWNALKAYANENGISIMGDMPLYVAYDSVEVWKYGDRLFRMDGERKPYGVAGCPPDAFTEDGQLWGNPVYDWEKMRLDGYSWWNKRIADCFKLFDILRIDHFRGFDRYYEVAPGAPTAREGKWMDGPKEELFKDKLGYNIVAEDLGVIDDGVRRLMKNVGYPGMKVLIFAFDGSPNNEHKPSNYTENYVCYTGTHDNIPVRQYIEDLSEREREIYKKDLAKECEAVGFEADLTSAAAMCKSVVELAFLSRAGTVIIPLCDLLAFGGEARINLPSTVSDKNWSWRFIKEDFSEESLQFLREIAIKSNRI